MHNESDNKQTLFDQLKKLNRCQFKAFFGFLVHQWANNKFFISDQNFFNLWCELNFLCHEFDESFPEQYDNFDEVRSFCKAHPYHFIETLPIDLVSALFAENADNRIDVLIDFSKILFEVDMLAAFAYAIQALGITESAETLVSEAQDYIKYFS